MSNYIDLSVVIRIDLFDQLVKATHSTAEDERPPPSHRGLSLSTRSQILRYLLLTWRSDNIAVKCGVSLQTVYNIQNNIIRYRSTEKSQYWLLKHPSKLTVVDKQALFD